MDRPSYIIKLDMIDNGTVSTGIRLKQGDAGIALYLRIYNNGNPYYDAKEVPTVYFKRPDGSSVFGSAQTGYDNMYVYVIAGNELQSAGTVIMDVKFTFAAGRESSASCTIECVQDTLADKVTGSAIYWNDAQKILDDLSKAITNAQTIEAQLQQAIIEAPELIEELGLDNYTLLTDFGSHTGNDVIHADADGNVASASKLQVARKINGVDFDGSEDIEIDATSTVEITWAEYQALTDEEKNNGTIYIITDKTLDSQIASGVTYNNSSSGLSATNVQSAIDEVKNKFDGMVKTLSFSITTNANGFATVQLSTIGHLVIDVRLDTNSYWATTRTMKNGYYYVIVENYNGTRVANTSVTGTIYYIDK